MLRRREQTKERVEPTTVGIPAVESPHSTRITLQLLLLIQLYMWRNHHASPVWHAVRKAKNNESSTVARVSIPMTLLQKAPRPPLPPFWKGRGATAPVSGIPACETPQWFVSCRHVTGFTVTLVVTCSKPDRVKFKHANVRKLTFPDKSLRSFMPKTKSSTIVKT